MEHRKITVLSTGGTVAMRTPRKSKGAERADICEVMPRFHIKGIEYEINEIMRKSSTSILTSDWVTIADAIHQELKKSVDGVVVLHGTDTLHYTAAALSFMLRNPPVPVVITGSMIPSGDRGSDGPSNFEAALKVAAFADLAEVCVVFSADAAGRKKAIIRGTRARKVRSISRNAFESINEIPLGIVTKRRIILKPHRSKRGERRVRLQSRINPKVCIIKNYPGLSAERFHQITEGLDGVIFEGNGVGHFRGEPDMFEAMRSFNKPIGLTTQCAYEGVRLGGYASDRRILAVRNLIPLVDMLPEVALVKMMWALGHGRDIRQIMLSNLVGEISPRFVVRS